MIRGIGGRLLSSSFIQDLLFSMEGVMRPPPGTARALRNWSQRIEATLGSTSGTRTVTDTAFLPLLELLDLNVARRHDENSTAILHLLGGPGTAVLGLATRWGESFDRRWRTSITEAIAADARWCLCCNGRALRLVDARRTWSRDYLEFDLDVLGQDEDAQAVLWAVAHARALSGAQPLLDRAVELSRRHGLHVCRSLGTGVLDALEVLVGAMASRGRPISGPLWEHALTVLYRILFLLFAEARGLVPVWNPIYRDRYSLEVIVTALLDGRAYRGVSRSIQAISRLAHSGCVTGALRVTAFNGRLFAPAEAGPFDRAPVSDAAMSSAVLSLSSTPITTKGGRFRIVYRDLDVEQLGAVYEHVLDYEPDALNPRRLQRTREARKASGTFYTPRRMTAYLIERTLGPLVKDRSAEGILQLRVLDPAMGSGAFLVAACRFLASACEAALVREGHWSEYDVTPGDHAGLRRDVAARCLFGVDRNPTAVQLARLSLWLATLAADKPLSFLDHHLLVGDSLVGASPDDVGRQPGGGHTKGRLERLPLFDHGELPSALERAAKALTEMAAEPDDSVEIVRAKERRLVALRSDSDLVKWARLLDLWCAGWFWPQGAPPDRGLFLDLMAGLLDRRATLPARQVANLLRRADSVASVRKFLHWPLAFPEVFLRDARSTPGFDAIVGNPPWDMVRSDHRSQDEPASRATGTQQLKQFVRESGIYQIESRAHLNLYQLFSERALQLVKPGGRIGLVVPSGLMSDIGAAPFRRHLFDRSEVDEVTGFNNRHAIFPVHRSMRFVLLTCSAGRPTTSVACRFGLTKPEELEQPGRAPLVLSRRLLSRLSGDEDLGMPEFAGERDLRIVEAITASTPQLRSPDGWHVSFGRELNASEDRHLFVPADARTDLRPVLEGKQIEPFRVSLGGCRYALRAADADKIAVPRRSRLAYRDVASADNRLTLISAIVPARAVTTHTLFCLRTPLPLAQQRVLCALLNSLVANFLVRLRVSTHVTVSLVARLPVPVVRPEHEWFGPLSALTFDLMASRGPIDQLDAYHDVQALAARLYGLTETDLDHVLATFPLLPDTMRRAVQERFARVGRH